MLKIDLHLHTIMSGHGLCTIKEYIDKSKELKMKAIGISDHGPKVPGCLTNNHYFGILTESSDIIDGMRVLKGVEANIINQNGDIDIPEKYIKRLDYVMANIHTDITDKKDRKTNTKAIINCIKSGYIKILSHPHSNFYDIDLKKVCEQACKNNILLEVDLVYLKKRIDPKMILNLKTMIDIVKKHRKKVIINTDSHSIWELGDDTVLTKELKKKIGLTDDMIINNYPKELEKFLGVKF